MAFIQTIRDYELVDELGRGGMGVVYKAVHGRLNRVVALKTLNLGKDATNEDLKRFDREMQAVGRLIHPNIVRATDAGTEDGLHYLVMEFVEGIDLNVLMKRRGAISVADACYIGMHVALALRFAHEHRIIHRDIKPSNIMLTGTGHIKVLDFGLAKAVDPEGQSVGSTSYAGTPLFSAPEQFSSTVHVTPSVDVFGLAGTLYLLLAGKLPYPDLNTKLTCSTPPNCESDLKHIPGDLADLLKCMLDRNPNHRPDIGSVIEVFRHYVPQSQVGQLVREVAPELQEQAAPQPNSFSPYAPTKTPEQHEISTRVYMGTTHRETILNRKSFAVGLGALFFLAMAAFAAGLFQFPRGSSEFSETVAALRTNEYRVEWTGGFGKLLGLRMKSPTSIHVDGNQVTIDYGGMDNMTPPETFRGTISGKRMEGTWQGTLGGGPAYLEFNDDYSIASGYWTGPDEEKNPWQLVKVK